QPLPTLFPYTTLFRSENAALVALRQLGRAHSSGLACLSGHRFPYRGWASGSQPLSLAVPGEGFAAVGAASASSRTAEAAVPTSSDRKSTRLNSSHVAI